MFEFTALTLPHWELMNPNDLGSLTNQRRTKSDLVDSRSHFHFHFPSGKIERRTDRCGYEEKGDIPLNTQITASMVSAECRASRSVIRAVTVIELSLFPTTHIQRRAFTVLRHCLQRWCIGISQRSRDLGTICSRCLRPFFAGWLFEIPPRPITEGESRVGIEVPVGGTPTMCRVDGTRATLS